MRQSGSGIAWQGFSQVRMSHLTCHPASVTLSSQFNFMRHVRSAGLMASMHREDPARQAVLPTAPFPARGPGRSCYPKRTTPRDTARRTGRSVNAYALRQPDYLARGIGVTRVRRGEQDKPTVTFGDSGIPSRRLSRAIRSCVAASWPCARSLALSGWRVVAEMDRRPGRHPEVEIGGFL
jgi:hypothetical protein